MSKDAFLLAMSQIIDAAIDPRLWEPALGSVARAFGVAGAGCTVRNTSEKIATWQATGGLGANLADEYMRHYSRLDPMGVLLDEASEYNPVYLSKLLPGPMLARSEWYNDFMLKLGVTDSFCIVLGRMADQSLLFGLHSDRKEREVPRPDNQYAPLIGRTIQRAMYIRNQFRGLDWKSVLAEQSLKHLPFALIVVEENGRVLEMNENASKIVEANDGPIIRQGRLQSRRAFESDRLLKLISGATSAKTNTPFLASQMVMARSQGNEPYFVTVAPLKSEIADYARPLAIVLIAEPAAPTMSEKSLVSLFGLSPAEMRIAVGLVAGKSLSEIAEDAGVKITTVRTQLRSVLNKVGAKRQVDLVRLFTRASAVGGRGGDRG